MSFALRFTAAFVLASDSNHAFYRRLRPCIDSNHAGI
jgi:hypothetical protein